VPQRTNDESQVPRRSPGFLALLGRFPWAATLLSAVVLLSSTVPLLPVRDARTFEAVPEAHLVHSPAYTLLAPLSNVLDTLTLVSRGQHVALLLGLVAVFLLGRGLVAFLRRPASPLRSHALATLAFVVVVIVTYGATAVLPRPMAALSTDDASLLIIDFHSHTSASHDGRRGFDAERSRAWHAAAGFDVAYVTDHSTVLGAEEGTAFNPIPAANGTTLLQGIETGWDGEHVGILGAERVYKGLLTADLANIDTAALRLANTLGGREPIVVWNHPHQLGRIPAASDTVLVGVRAVEISNGDPSAIDRMRALHDSINTFADRSNLALTTGTDNHGWGRAAPNWTLMQLAGWRATTGDELERNIEKALREGGYGITRPVERVVATPRSRASLGLSVVTIPWTMLRTLSTEERVAWLAWIWIFATAAWWRRRRRAAA
jgi:hypothetical protein